MMKELLQSVFSTAYLAPIGYFALMQESKKILVENDEHYIKQTYRNRCLIYTTNGFFPLTVPVNRVNGNHTKVKDIEISYFENWQQHHWRSIVSAYSQSPFFMYYMDDLEVFFNKRIKFLLDFNTQLTQHVFDCLDLNPEITFTQKFIEKDDPSILDLRNKFNPKKKDTDVLFPEYIQVFSDKHGFIPNLSIIDLLFNEGPNALSYLEGLISSNSRQGIINKV